MDRANLRFKPRKTEKHYYFTKNGRPVLTAYTVHFDAFSIRRSLRGDNWDISFNRSPVMGGKYCAERQFVRCNGVELLVASNPAPKMDCEIRSINRECIYTNKYTYRFSFQQFIYLLPREFMREFLWRVAQFERALKAKGIIK